MKTPLCLVIAGPQGSGKGTQCQKLIREFAFNYFEMGAILRQAQLTNTVIKSYMDEGKHVPAEYTDHLVTEFVSKNTDQDILIDGYPRNNSQAQVLSKALEETKHHVKIIFLEVEKKILVQRMLSRGRADDTIDVINNRLDQFYKLTIPAILDFEGLTKSHIFTVNAEQAPDQVYTSIEQNLSVFV